MQKIPLPYAVFDLHFHPQNPSIFAIATSTACVALFQISTPSSAGEGEGKQKSESTIKITQLWTRSVHEDPSIPALFLAWTPDSWLSRENADGFAVTFSDGATTVFGAETPTTQAEDKGLSAQCDEIIELGSFAAKQMIEVWFVALATYEDESAGKVPFMFTGNDFGSLHTRRYQSLSSEDEGSEELLPPILLEHDDRARHHTAGVTAILPLPVGLKDDAPLVLTGSYDEYLRVYHATRRGEVLAETCLGGGVWRLQLLRTERVVEGNGETCKFLVLASCMHAGTRVVRVSCAADSAWEMEVLAEFTEHESMNYASDVWKPRGGYDLQGETPAELLCVSSSFYDRRLCTWRVNV